MTRRILSEAEYIAHQAKRKPMGAMPRVPAEDVAALAQAAAKPAGSFKRQRPVAQPADISVTIPIRTYSTLNSRVHWAERARRTKRERAAVTLVLSGKKMWLPCVVRLTRVGPRRLDDDNAQGSMKACRDAVAACLGADDADPGIKWEYAQEKGEYAVRIEVRAA